MSDRPGAANNLLKALRQVFKYAVNYDLLEKNPIENVEKLKPKNKDGFHAWTEDEIRQFEDYHPVGSMARLAMALMLYTGQRRSNVYRMGPGDVEDVWMNVFQVKSHKTIDLPIVQKLKDIIDATPVGEHTYIVSAKNKPFESSGSFGNWFAKQCNAAGLPNCRAHGLRKAAAARLAEIGCSPHEIMAITGHDSLSEVTRYTRSVNQRKLAENVLRRVDGN